MDRTLPIGMFDSGIGGLTVMQAVKAHLPAEHIIYFGDTARVPYGNKGQETIIRYSVENANFLISQSIKLMVIACHTASALALKTLQETFSIPIIDVITPGAAAAVAATRNGRIAVLGTRSTIQSGIYQKEISRLLPDGYLFSLACPLFVPLVEEQMIDHPATQLIVREYLSSLNDHNIDTILLGCTHYPFLRSIIQKEMGPDVTLIDSAKACALQINSVLIEQDLHNQTFEGICRYYVSDDPIKFAESGAKLFGQQLSQISTVRIS